jgi:two-component system cell cycle sensor histidine kinase/response regulator CckA
MATMREAGVLLIDDDEFVRDVARVMLERSGFRVLEARDGATGVQVLGARRDEVQLVLLDLSMPGISGAEALIRLRDVDASVPVVVLSGDSEEEAREQLVGLATSGFVGKPFRMDTIVGAVRRGLTAAA